MLDSDTMTPVRVIPVASALEIAVGYFVPEDPADATQCDSCQ